MTLGQDVRDGLRLPLDALRLLGRRWPEVLAWAVGGYVVHEALIRGAAGVALSDPYLAIGEPRFKTGADVDVFHRTLGFGILGFAALATLVTTIGVFYTLRREVLPEPRQHERLGTRAVRFHHVLALTLAPFLGFYAGWGLLDVDQDYYGWLGRNRAVDLADVSVAGLGWWILGVAVAAFVVKATVGGLARRTGLRGLALLESVLEATYLYLGVFGLAHLLRVTRVWVETRVAWRWLVDGYHSLLANLPDPLHVALPQLLDTYASVVGWTFGNLKEAIVQPLIWLAIAVIAYQHIGSRDEPGAPARKLGRTALLVQASTRGAREKYVAFVAAARAALRAGLVPFLFFCVWYLAVDVAVGWSWPLLARHVIGPQDLPFWGRIHDWQRLLEAVLLNVLRLPLLAAGFALVARRVRARTEAPRQTSGSSLP